jgi:hypothetical protein
LSAGLRLRSVVDGQVGFLARDEQGNQVVRLDRPTGIGAENRTVPYKEDQWKAAPDEPLPPMSIARICYEADKALRHSRGEYTIADWQSIYDRPAGRDWMLGPPKGASDERKAFYAHIRKFWESR